MGKSIIETLRRVTEPAYFKFFLIPRARMKQTRCIREIRKEGKAKIVFIVSSLPMWRLQSLFNQLQDDVHFDVSIAIYPFNNWPCEQKARAMEELRDYFSQQGIQILDLSQKTFPGKSLREMKNPDLIFYPQPYNHLFWNDLDNQYFEDKLVCYIPYGMPVVRLPWIDKTLLHNTAWRVFLHSESRKQQAQSVLFNHGRNIRVTGEPISDLFKLPAKNQVWKKQEQQKKRVIWAPHYSILSDDLLHQNSFLWLSDSMLKIAENYKDQIQFSFKPHPRLFLTLCELPDWGRKRAEAYYKAWREGENTQLDIGYYIDLFKDADAMIHDSSSFTAEFHYTKKPVLFTTKNADEVINTLNEFGKEALSAHYFADSEEKIVDFIEKTVLGGDDPKKPERESFYQKYLLPPNGQSVAENIYDEILSGLGWRKRKD